MKLSEIIKNLDLIVLNAANEDADIKNAYASDLLSDVMGNADADELWITMQTHKNVAAIASLKDIPAVVLINNGKPDVDMLEHAKLENVAVLVTNLACYEFCAKLYNLINSEL